MLQSTAMDNETATDRLADNLLKDADARMQYQQDYTLAGIKTLVLLEGGAIISLLTYAGHSPGVTSAQRFQAAFISYVAALALNVIAYLLAYTCQALLSRYSVREAFRLMNLDSADKVPAETLRRRGEACGLVAVVICVLSLVGFVIGSWFAMQGIV